MRKKYYFFTSAKFWRHLYFSESIPVIVKGAIGASDLGNKLFVYFSFYQLPDPKEISGFTIENKYYQIKGVRLLHSRKTWGVFLKLRL